MSKVSRVLEDSMEAAMRNFMRAGYKGVTETWNVLQHEVRGGGTLRVFGKFNIKALSGVFCLQND